MEEDNISWKSLSEETVRNSLMRYFYDGYLEAMKEAGYSLDAFLTREQIEPLVEKAISRMMKETDRSEENPGLTYHIYDHMFHWLVSLSIQEPVETTMDFSLSPMDLSTTYIKKPISDLTFFLENCARSCIEDPSKNYINIKNIELYSATIDEVISSCAGCSGLIRLLEVSLETDPVIGNLNAMFIFSCKTQNGAITYKIPWPQL